MSLFDLTGRVAVVTGGNGGIGLGMARGMAEAGASIAVAGRNMKKSEAGKKRGGLMGTLQRVAGGLGVASLFVRLYFQPVVEHEVPENVRMVPAW
jgi:2-deoxy-D-gluconate 3-dehydrogenase